MPNTNQTAAVFTGQGSQRPGMAKDFYDNHDIAKKIFTEASEAINEDMPALCFEENDRLDLTEYTQPAIVTTEIAIYSVIAQKYGFAPQYFAGHSLGEYAALVAAGVIPFTDAVKIVKERGRLMQEAVPEGVGGMAAVIAEDLGATDYEKITTEAGAEVANYNSSGQVVISGKKEAVEQALETMGKEYPDMRLIPLPVSAPFHSSLMNPIESKFREYLENFAGNFRSEKTTQVLSNFSGVFHTPETLIDNLIKQLSGSVRWTQNMQVLKDTGASIYEIGPNKVLAKFFASIDVSVPAIINERAAKKAFES